MRALAAEARTQLGGHVDVLVNNAGVYPGGPTESLEDDTVDALLATNIRAPHVLVAALAPGMAERGSGHIVNIGSWMARVGVPFMALYPATKAAVEQLTRAWPPSTGTRGIRVVTVAPERRDPGNADSADVLAAMTQGTPPASRCSRSKSPARCAGWSPTRPRSSLAAPSMSTAASRRRG